IFPKYPNSGKINPDRFLRSRVDRIKEHRLHAVSKATQIIGQLKRTFLYWTPITFKTLFIDFIDLRTLFDMKLEKKFINRYGLKTSPLNHRQTYEISKMRKKLYSNIIFIRKYIFDFINIKCSPKLKKLDKFLFEII
ncbi:hypothetical protein BpHYR1_044995, partial [Brachionus plicatilis]